MKYRRKLFSVKNAYDVGSTDELFALAVKENCKFQYENCAEYRKILDNFGFSPDDIKSFDDIAELPFLPTLFFKNHHAYSMPKSRHFIKATSSGTKGKFSKIGFELSGLLCGLRMVLKIAGKRKLFSPRPANYVIFGYKPHRGNQTAVTKTARGATFFAPALRRVYALKYGKDGYYPDLEGVVKAIEKYGESRFPIRFMGFPAYTYFVLKMMDDRGIRINAPKGSKIMLGGGWKQFYAEQVDKTVLYDLAKRVLNIDDNNIIEFFGAVEHPILYCDCPCHHFHVPVYSRVIIRDVNTFKPLENGKIGLVNLITPMVKATPVLSIMTDDLGVLHDGENCPCAISSPYLEIIGRIGLKDIKTCAAGAAELIANAAEVKL